jgi:hypothetical protein
MSQITLAVVGMETYKISTEGPSNRVKFDVPITIDHFKTTFFNNNILCIEKNCLTIFEGFEGFDTSECPSYVPVNVTASDEVVTTPFDVYDFLLQCASADLNYATITYTSKIELKKNVNSIQYLSDLSIISGLRWSEVSDSVILDNKFVVVAVFTNPNCLVKNAVLEFTYTISTTDALTE